MIKLAIVILNWNGKALLERFLPAVLANTPDYASVFIADNGSTDGSAELMADTFPDVPFLQLGTNYGYAGGYNRALQQIEAKYFVLLNSDIEVSHRWIEPIITLMEKDDQIGACQPKILSFEKRNRFEYAGAAGGYLDQYGYPFCRGRIFDHLEADDGQYNDQKDIFWATGACLFLRASAFFKAGLFDEDFFAHMEEIDFCWRLQSAGFAVAYTPDAEIFHVGGGTLSHSNPRKTFLNFRNNLAMLAKNLSGTSLLGVLLLRFGLDNLAAFKFLLEGKAQDARAVLRAQINFYANFFLWRKKRRLKKKEKNEFLIWRRNLLFYYYIKKVNKFSQLPHTPEIKITMKNNPKTLKNS